MKTIQNNLVENNLVEKYLKQFPDKKLSLRTMQRELKLAKNCVFFLAMNSRKVRKVNPLEVGSDKHKLSVFTYNDVPDVISEVDVSQFNESEENIID